MRPRVTSTPQSKIGNQISKISAMSVPSEYLPGPKAGPVVVPGEFTPVPAAGTTLCGRRLAVNATR